MALVLATAMRPELQGFRLPNRYICITAPLLGLYDVPEHRTAGSSSTFHVIPVSYIMHWLAVLCLLLLIPPSMRAEARIVITEIMFDPLPAGRKSGAEYVELYNSGTLSANVVGWKLYDATGKAQATLPAHTPAIEPGGRLLLASDTTLFFRFPYLRDSSNVLTFNLSSFGLNADGDEIVLRDMDGRVIDSLAYASNWHRRDFGEMKGIALERISMTASSTDSRNWSSSAAPLGGTPAALNTVAIAPVAYRAELTVDPPTVSPDGDGYNDFSRVSYRLPSRNARITALVYDRHGRPVRHLASNEPAAAQGELIWDGRDDDGRPLAPGIFVVRVESYDDDGRKLLTARGTAIVARRIR